MLTVDHNDLPLISGTTPIVDIGYTRMTMPGVFVAGCNFQCPYCINRELVIGPRPHEFNPSSVISTYMLSGEKWVMVSGAEALLNEKTPNLLSHIKSLGMNVALATNGSLHGRLVDVVSHGLVDYVVMDIKTSFDLDKYRAVSGTSMSQDILNDIVSSVDFLIERSSPYFGCEFRMTACSKYVDRQDAIEVAKYLEVPQTFVLQMFTTHQTLLESVAQQKYVISYDELLDWADEIDQYVGKAFVREV